MEGNRENGSLFSIESDVAAFWLVIMLGNRQCGCFIDRILPKRKIYLRSPCLCLEGVKNQFSVAFQRKIDELVEKFRRELENWRMLLMIPNLSGY
jgi:hypothetical protein